MNADTSRQGSRKGLLYGLMSMKIMWMIYAISFLSSAVNALTHLRDILDWPLSSISILVPDVESIRRVTKAVMGVHGNPPPYEDTHLYASLSIHIYSDAYIHIIGCSRC